jgi:hypothetical protein
MNIRSTHKKIKLTLSKGIPPQEFLGKAWSNEPLTTLLTNTNIPFSLPGIDEDISLVAKNEEGDVIGQCSANKAVKYWEHIESLDPSQQNLSTQIFIKINQKAIQDEQKHLNQIQEPREQAIHSAGIAVLPEYWGNEIGMTMREEQLKTCKANNATTLFCETTNLFSAATVRKFDFQKIAEYPYKDLARELSHEDLKRLDDSFTIWCKRI